MEGNCLVRATIDSLVVLKNGLIITTNVGLSVLYNNYQFRWEEGAKGCLIIKSAVEVVKTQLKKSFGAVAISGVTKNDVEYLEAHSYTISTISRINLLLFFQNIF
jgi:hypothetical protein